MQPAPSAGEHATGANGGKHATGAKRGKTRNRWETGAKREKQTTGAMRTLRRKTFAMGGETWHFFKGENATSAKRGKNAAGTKGRKTCNQCQARENVQPVLSAGKLPTGANRGKMYNRCYLRLLCNYKEMGCFKTWMFISTGHKKSRQ